MLETDRESTGFDKPGIFDSHAHYDDKQFDPDRDELLIGMSERGVEYILNAGSSVETTLKTVELTGKYPFIYGSAGVHPEECGDMTEADVEIIRKAVLENEKIVAIGGLITTGLGRTEIFRRYGLKSSFGWQENLIIRLSYTAEKLPRIRWHI